MKFHELKCWIFAGREHVSSYAGWRCRF